MKPRILIANRDPDVQEILSVALRHAGYEPHALTEPGRILHEVDGCALVITDYPISVDRSGTITRMLRENPDTARIPILNATTHALPSELANAQNAGVSASIVLPSLIEAILEKVSILIVDTRSA
jgi:CheY-like chemotaxis protein